jgi:hypothetical protein
MRSVAFDVKRVDGQNRPPDCAKKQSEMEVSDALIVNSKLRQRGLLTALVERIYPRCTQETETVELLNLLEVRKANKDDSSWKSYNTRRNNQVFILGEGLVYSYCIY